MTSAAASGRGPSRSASRRASRASRVADESNNMLAHQVGHVLRYIWDPIGLGENGPADEYDSYVSGVVTLVEGRTAFETVLAEHLMRIEAEMMGMVPAKENAVRAARALLGLREASTRAPNMLVAQFVSPDGLRSLWVFRRPDGLCTYEHAALRHEDDENGAWSWWIRVGDVESGLFPTGEAAEMEARATIDWLRC